MIFPEIIRLFDVCILNLLHVCSFDLYFSFCSERCLYDILKSRNEEYRATFSSEVRAKTNRNIVQVSKVIFLEVKYGT